MTTITSWMSVSGTGTRTLYLGADSQGSELETGVAVSHNMKKVFASTVTPEIFAFAGDASWGAHFLRNLLVAISRGQLTEPIGTIKRSQEIVALACAKRPPNPACDLAVLYGVRSDTDVDGSDDFRLYRLYHSGRMSSQWDVCRIYETELAGPTSTLLHSGGSGAVSNNKRQGWIAGGDQGDVARTCFWSLCDRIEGVPKEDPLTGGVPQLVKLDQKGSGVAVGVAYHRIATVYGSRVSTPKTAATVWVDENFTQLDPRTLQPFSRAQRYGRPKNSR